MRIQVGAMRPLVVSLGWCLGTSPVSHVISKLDRVFWDGVWLPSVWSHVYLLFEWEYGPALIYESLMSTGVHVTPFDRLARSGKVVRHYEHDLGLNQEQAVKLWNACVRLEGAGYDFKKIAALYAWIRWAGRSALKRPALLDKTIDDNYICAEFVEAVTAQVGVDLCGTACTPATVTPESLWISLMGGPSSASMPQIRERGGDVTLSVEVLA